MAGGREPDRGGPFPLGAAVTVADLDGDPHPLLHRLRAAEPVSWLPAVGGWLVTRHDLALAVMRDSRGFTVDDPRFSTAQVVGPSMLSLDGGPHRRHRDPFSAAFRGAAARDRLESLATRTAYSLVNELKSAGQSRYGGAAELRRGLAGPLAVAVVTGLLGLQDTDPAEVLAWYDAIVTAVTALSARRSLALPGSGRGWPGRVFSDWKREELRLRSARRAADRCSSAASQEGGLTPDEVASDAAVLMFGGIETTEGMISNAVLHLLSHPAVLAAVRGGPVPAARRGGRVAAAGAGRGRGRPVRHRATPSWPAPGSAAATWSACRSPGPTGTRRCSIARTSSPPAARARSTTWASPADRTSAPARSWRPRRPRPRSARCSTCCPGCASTQPPAARRRAAWCSASRRSSHVRWDAPAGPAEAQATWMERLARPSQ